MSNKELEKVLGIENSASQIIIRLSDIELVDKAKLNILQQGIDGDIKTWKELSSYVEQISGNFDIIFGIINFVSLIASAVAIAVVMFINVESKIREIGILKAIGARNFFVLRVFLAEVLLYAFLGITLGVMLAYFVSVYLQAFPMLHFVTGGTGSISVVPIPAFIDIIRSGITVFVVTLIAGMYPAWIATRVDIIKAIWKG